MIYYREALNMITDVMKEWFDKQYETFVEFNTLKISTPNNVLKMQGKPMRRMRGLRGSREKLYPN